MIAEHKKEAWRLVHKKGNSLKAVAVLFGKTEATIRRWLKPESPRKPRRRKRGLPGQMELKL